MEIDDIKDAISGRRKAYVETFQSPQSQKVLRDLAVFCRANESTFAVDPRAHALAEGRREVFLRIVKHLHLSDEQLLSYYDLKA